MSILERTDLQRREEEVLAPYAGKSARNRGRRYPETEHPLRSAFQRDRDRVVHSTAFRRLEYKTQVFINHEGDHYRTRLTHTLEVAQIARTIARALRLNEDLTEALALAHDVGHTPFGHSGEDALHELMRDHGGFEHNRQGLRVVDELERSYPAFPGLNLTYEVREGMAKHKTSYDVPTPDEFEPDRRSLLEAQAVNIADAIAYDNHDVDDGLRAGIICPDELRALELWGRAEKALTERFGALEGHFLRRQMVISIINSLVNDVVTSTQARLDQRGVRSIEDVRSAETDLVDFSADMRQVVQELEAFLFENVYRHYRVVRMAEKAKRFVQEMFRTYAGSPEQLPPRHQRRADSDGIHRTVCDYIAGMTDRYAMDEYTRLYYPYHSVWEGGK